MTDPKDGETVEIQTRAGTWIRAVYVNGRFVYRVSKQMTVAYENPRGWRYPDRK